MIEAKRFLNWKVIQQACRRIGLATWVSVAVPPRSYCSNAGIVLCHWGIGCLEAKEFDGRFHVQEQLKPRTYPRAVPPYVWNQLDARQETFCAAGSPGGAAWSPFKDTCAALRRIVHNQPGIPLNEAIAAIHHHYASTASARRSLAHWIRLGKVAGIKATRTSCLRLYEAVAEQAR